MAKEEKAAEKTAAAEQPTADKQAEKQAAKEQSPTADLEKQVADLKQQLKDQEDKYLRAEAEIQHMTKRFNKEREGLLKYDGQDLAKGILPVLDNLKRALSIEVEDENGKQLKKGIQMVHDHLEQALTAHGVTEVAALGKPFDPQTSQAVQTVPVEDGQEADTVVQVLQAGYLLKDRVLRPAMVVVAQ